MNFRSDTAMEKEEEEEKNELVWFGSLLTFLTFDVEVSLLREQRCPAQKNVFQKEVEGFRKSV